MFKKISPLLMMLPVLAVPQPSAATKLARSIPLCSWVPCGQMRCDMYIMNARLGMLPLHHSQCQVAMVGSHVMMTNLQVSIAKKEPG